MLIKDNTHSNHIYKRKRTEINKIQQQKEKGKVRKKRQEVLNEGIEVSENGQLWWFVEFHFYEQSYNIRPSLRLKETLVNLIL